MLNNAIKKKGRNICGIGVQAYNHQVGNVKFRLDQFSPDGRPDVVQRAKWRSGRVGNVVTHYSHHPSRVGLEVLALNLMNPSKQFNRRKTGAFIKQRPSAPVAYTKEILFHALEISVPIQDRDSALGLVYGEHWKTLDQRPRVWKEHEDYDSLERYQVGFIVQHGGKYYRALRSCPFPTDNLATSSEQWEELLVGSREDWSVVKYYTERAWSELKAELEHEAVEYLARQTDEDDVAYSWRLGMCLEEHYLAKRTEILQAQPLVSSPIPSSSSSSDAVAAFSDANKKGKRGSTFKTAKKPALIRGKSRPAAGPAKRSFGSSSSSSSSSSDDAPSQGRPSRKRFKPETFDPGASNNAGFFETRAFKQRGWEKKQNLKKEASKKRKTSRKKGQKFPSIPRQGPKDI